MQLEREEEKEFLPHHIQLPLCTSRLPYRQGRKLTAVKVYTVASESNHLLIFGVPALNIRQETKAQFLKFGKLLKFNISIDHPADAFTEVYHAQYEKIQSARAAKRMLDTKNFYGSSLHICYAPELESVEETRHKLWQRQKDVLYRLKNLPISTKKDKADVVQELVEEDSVKLNMGKINVIGSGKKHKLTKNKRLKEAFNNFKKFKPCFIESETVTNTNQIATVEHKETDSGKIKEKSAINHKNNDPIEIVDCTSISKEVITNVNEHLNYDKFGDEDIRRVPRKAASKIVFHINKIS